MKKDVKILLFLSVLGFCFSFFVKAEGMDSTSYLKVQFFGDNGVIIRCDTAIEGELIIPERINGKTVTAIADEAFSKCEKLTKVIIPQTVTSIGEKAFSECTGLIEVEMSDSVTAIGNAMFYQCCKLENVKLSSGVSCITDNMFYFCENLTYVNMPSSACYIGENAFFGCRSLESMIISDGVSFISARAFANCDSLERIYIPSAVENICEDAFDKCMALNTVYYQGDESDFNNISVSVGNERLIIASFDYHHGHTPENTTVIYSADCLNSGRCKWSCLCGYEQYDGIAATGHTMTDYETVKEADCKNNGISRSCCTVCDYYIDCTIPSGGHSTVADSAVSPTCVKTGRTAGSHCVVCGDTVVPQTEIHAAGHSFTVKIKDKKHLASKATYLKAETYYFTCSVCGEISNDKTFTGEKLVIGKIKSADFSSESKSVTLCWSKLSSVRGYAVYIKNSDGKWKLYKRVLKNTAEITGLSTGKNYEFGIKGYVIEDGTLVYANGYKVVKASTKPEEPQGLSYSSNRKAVTLKWKEVKNATGYRVYRYDSNKDKWVTVKSYTKTNKITFDNLQSGRRYKYAVRAVIDTGDKLVFSKRSKSVAACTKPSSPAVRATAYKYSVRLEWNDISFADGYVVYIASEPNGKYRKLADTAKTAFKAENLKSGRIYYFKVYSYRLVSDEKVYSNKTVKKVKTK